MFTIHGLRHIAFYKALSVSREQLQMELDTGAAVSVMSEQTQTNTIYKMYLYKVKVFKLRFVLFFINNRTYFCCRTSSAINHTLLD